MSRLTFLDSCLASATEFGSMQQTCVCQNLPAATKKSYTLCRVAASHFSSHGVASSCVNFRSVQNPNFSFSFPIDSKNMPEELCLVSTIEIAETRGNKCNEVKANLKKVREKMVLKRLSTIQDLEDGFMALADIRDGKGWCSKRLMVASSGLLSASISTHNNWVSC